MARIHYLSDNRIKKLRHEKHGGVFNAPISQRTERRGSNGSKLAIRVANYVKHHLSEPITAEAIARELYMGRSYFSTKFKEETGLSVTDFVLMQKVEEARRLLVYTDRAFSDIAAYLGFSSQSHFNRVFKNYTGKTPKEYRN